MVSSPKLSQAAELKWFADSVTTDYSIILDIRNESAVAALALHQWTLYDRNNKVYTKLFRERSTDNTLPEYVRTMKSSENSKTVAVILLFLLLLQLPIAYYLLYYRHVVTYRFAVDRIRDINLLLLSDQSIPEKLKRIREIWSKKSRHTRANFRLDEVVHEIEEELKRGQDLSNGKEADNQLLEDELRRVRFENDRLHVSNSVLDNCLSTLKHETMYYPSRIRQLIEASPDDVASLKELVDYYKSIYLMLSAQAMEQVETNLKCDDALKDYLFRLIQETVKDLAKAHGIAITQVKQEIKTVHTAYATCQFVFSGLRYDDSLHHLLFTPLTVDMRFLVCRQIVREMGETTNLRGCGIQAKPSDDGFLVIEVVLPGMLV